PVFLLMVVSTPILLRAQQSSKTDTDVADQSELVEPAAQVSAAINHKDAVKAASFYTEDATLMPSEGPMVHGRSQVEAFVKQWLDEGVADVVVTPIISYKIGDRGYEVANFQLSARTGADKSHVKGKLITILRRDPDGWRMEYEIWNTNPPAPK